MVKCTFYGRTGNEGVGGGGSVRLRTKENIKEELRN